MAQPTDLPTWATSATGLAATTAPTAGKQSDGWAPSERPPAQYFNFWMNRVGQWCNYLKNLAGEAITWTAKHTFSAGLASSVAPSAATDVVRKTELDTKAADAAVVHVTGNETVAGVKTFSSSPSVPTPAAAGDAASKGYVDGKFPAVGWSGLACAAGWSVGKPLGYFKDAAGVVHLKGSVQVGATPALTIFSAGALAPGSRSTPTYGAGFYVAWQNTNFQISVQPDGSVVINNMPTTGMVFSLDGISFVAEA